MCHRVRPGLEVANREDVQERRAVLAQHEPSVGIDVLIAGHLERRAGLVVEEDVVEELPIPSVRVDVGNRDSVEREPVGRRSDETDRLRASPRGVVDLDEDGPQRHDEREVRDDGKTRPDLTAPHEEADRDRRRDAESDQRDSERCAPVEARNERVALRPAGPEPDREDPDGRVAWATHQIGARSRASERMRRQAGCRAARPASERRRSCPRAEQSKRHGSLPPRGARRQTPRAGPGGPPWARGCPRPHRRSKPRPRGEGRRARRRGGRPARRGRRRCSGRHRPERSSRRSCGHLPVRS